MLWGLLTWEGVLCAIVLVVLTWAFGWKTPESKGTKPEQDVSDGVRDVEDLSAPRTKSGNVNATGSYMAGQARPTQPFYAFREVRSVHLEITDKCNAACPQCARSDRGGIVNHRLPLTELSLDDVKRIFPEYFVLQLEKVYMCGNYGDPTAVKGCLDIVRYFRETNAALQVAIHTNGGARTERWWEELGTLMQGPCFVRFGIDGLWDTNHMYRQKVNWSNLERNFRAFISSGGVAEWDYIVFRHNEHQIEEARQFAEDAGFIRFQTKKTGRFFNKKKGRFMDSTPVKDSTGEVVRHLKPPRNPEWVNEGLVEDLQNILARYGTIDNYHNKSCIDCKVLKKKEVYISADGLVFPCCWLAGHVYNNIPDQEREAVHLLKDNGLSLDDIRVTEAQSVEDIVMGPYFQHLVPGSWDQTSVEGGRLRTCADVCGVEQNLFDKQFTES